VEQCKTRLVEGMYIPKLMLLVLGQSHPYLSLY
jgi:hypothetical protein